MKKPAWTQREAIAEMMDVQFSRSQVAKLRKIMADGPKEEQKKKPTASAASSKKTARSASHA